MIGKYERQFTLFINVRDVAISLYDFEVCRIPGDCFRERGGIIVANLVGLRTTGVHLVGDEEGVLGEASADARAVLVSAVSCREDNGAVGGGGLEDGSSPHAGIAVEEEEDAPGGELDDPCSEGSHFERKQRRVISDYYK